MNESIQKKFQAIIRHFIGAGGNEKPLAGIYVSGQFCPEEDTEEAIARNLNAAFLIALSGGTHPCYEEASTYLESLKHHAIWGDLSRFYQTGLAVISSEIADACSTDETMEERIEELFAWVTNPSSLSNRKETIEKVRGVFFPEGVGLGGKKSNKMQELREKRKVRITKPNPNPIRNPAQEILFSSNILLTVPQQSKSIDSLRLSPGIKEALKEVTKEDQLFWYDHPIQMGVAKDNNEALYGVRGLEEAVRFELERGKWGGTKTLDCVLSVSVTHNGLHKIAKTYLQEEFSGTKPLEHLNLYVFTETETSRLVEEILAPAGDRYFKGFEHSLLHEIIGVDGEYGRHFSFLKAISAFWQVFFDPQIKGTFKIDLDQVFPQEELLDESGASAFEHLSTPLWGAEGIDTLGEAVSLGMIAGALVNERDINRSLFTPDVGFPSEDVRGDELIFLSPLPQALSTEAEMMTRYTDDDLNGEDCCIQRIHVTGGTCGVLIESLKRYRPFTPTFIGRAEDQAYVLSVLFADAQRHLRYVHKDGLIMRHDKEAFAEEAIKTAYMGKIVGDYARILWFTYYARALPWGAERIKSLIDPFTGCFVSAIPCTVVFLRLALKAAAFFASDAGDGYQKGLDLLRLGSQRLAAIIQVVTQEPNPLIEKYSQEKRGWDMYYNILERIEKGLREGDSFASELQDKAKTLLDDCKIA